jgi:hypothetical protein
MNIKEIFSKDLFRPINGVVKADQQDEAIVWQELDEYVVTRELDKHFRIFFDSYGKSIGISKDPNISGRIGVWISGFFGSGKSHFLKILSYILANKQAHNPNSDEKRQAMDFFKAKLGSDPMLLADVSRSAQTGTDVVLFNIDSKADPRDGHERLMKVFWKVFYELQGFCGEAPHIAEMERYLQSKGKLDAFHAAFKERAGSEWEQERDAWALNGDEIIESLASATGMSLDAAKDWFEKAENNINLSPEAFSKRVKEYLDTRGNNSRVIFLVDEVGQFIGSDTQLMLNLQTITEDLGRVCQGRAWVVVTSQEDIDAIIGDIRASKANDFSKIQGRFTTRLSLSSANTDEVIQTRLLEKVSDADKELKKLFEAKGDILRNQLSFTSDSATLRGFKTVDDFTKNYPFAPYHFPLVQKIFEAIRKAGATGLHLSRGERSMLDAFQSAAKTVAGKPLGALVPLYEFYPSIESFLDTSVKRTISQANENTGLKNPFDAKLLQVLFLIRYIDLLKPNIDNLTTLCIDEVDTDRLKLKREIEASLQRLEKETLINRNGDLFFFLTNEEREVGREIKGVDLSANDQTKVLAELIFTEVLGDVNKFKYKPYRRDYDLTRLCDGHPFTSKVDAELTVEIISPLHDEYSLFSESKCIMHSHEHEGRLVLRLGDTQDWDRELQVLVKTEKYIRQKNDAGITPTLKRILQDRADENRIRKTRLIQMLEHAIQDAEVFAMGQKIPLKANQARSVVDEGLEYLVKNLYTKFSYLQYLCDNPQNEVKAVLLADDLAKLPMDNSEGNPGALQEIRTWLDLMAAKNQVVILNELVERFAKKPYGWPEWETILLVAKLVKCGEISAIIDGAPVQAQDACAPFQKTGQWKTVKLIKKKIPTKEEVEKAQKLGKDLFGGIQPPGSEELKANIQSELNKWEKSLRAWSVLAETGNYPGGKEIASGIKLLDSLLRIKDTFEFITQVNQKRDDLLDLSDNMHDLTDFHGKQKPTWEKLRKALHEFDDNKEMLHSHPEAGSALTRMNEILRAPAPYGMLKDVEGLILKVKEANDALVEEKRKQALATVDEQIAHFDQHKDSALYDKVVSPLKTLKQKVAEEPSIPHISHYLATLNEMVEKGFKTISEVVDPKKPEKKTKPIKTLKLASLSDKPYLENESDINEFIDTLKENLLEAIKNDSLVKLL